MDAVLFFNAPAAQGMMLGSNVGDAPQQAVPLVVVEAAIGEQDGDRA